MRALARYGVIGVILAVAMMTGAGAQASATANLIKNGGFEKPVVPVGSFTFYDTGQSFTGWRVVGASGNVGVTSGKLQQDGITFNAKSGAQWMDLTGDSNSKTGVAQTVATTSGTRYTLTYWVGNVYDPGGPFGVKSTVKVYLNSVLKQTAENSIHPAHHRQAWKQFKLTFTATSGKTTISFINADPSNDSSNGLDAVQLT